jgi:hypothetical protein
MIASSILFNISGNRRLQAGGVAMTVNRHGALAYK